MGALVGKPLPTTVLLPGYVQAVSASGLETVDIVLVSASDYVGGQLLVYFGARGKGLPFVRSAPRVDVSAERIERSEELFERYGGAGIVLTNFVPCLRGLVLLPAEMASYPVGWVILYAFGSTLLYHGAVVTLSLGAVRMLS